MVPTARPMPENTVIFAASSSRRCGTAARLTRIADAAGVCRGAGLRCRVVVPRAVRIPCRGRRGAFERGSREAKCDCSPCARPCDASVKDPADPDLRGTEHRSCHARPRLGPRCNGVTHGLRHVGHEELGCCCTKVAGSVAHRGSSGGHRRQSPRIVIRDDAPRSREASRRVGRSPHSRRGHVPSGAGDRGAAARSKHEAQVRRLQRNPNPAQAGSGMVGAPSSTTAGTIACRTVCLADVRGPSMSRPTPPPAPKGIP